jgi:hypothetical protein
MPPKGKVKAPEAVTLVTGPLDGSAPVDFSPLLAALASDDSKQHEAVAETVGLLPCSEGVQVGLRHMCCCIYSLSAELALQHDSHSGAIADPVHV